MVSSDALNQVAESSYSETVRKLHSVLVAAGVYFSLISHLSSGCTVVDVYELQNETSLMVHCAVTVDGYKEEPEISVYSKEVEFRSELLCLLSKFFDKVSLN